MYQFCAQNYFFCMLMMFVVSLRIINIYFLLMHTLCSNNNIRNYVLL